MGTNNISAKSMYTMCMRKRKYRTIEYAEQKAKEFSKIYGVEQHPYYCPLCNYYHLTTKPKQG